MTLDPLEIDGALDPSLISDVIQRHMNQIRYCHAREASRSASLDLSGTVTLRAEIGASGVISTVDVVESTLPSETVQACLKGRLRFRFPETSDGQSPSRCRSPSPQRKWLRAPSTSARGDDADHALSSALMHALQHTEFHARLSDALATSGDPAHA